MSSNRVSARKVSLAELQPGMQVVLLWGSGIESHLTVVDSTPFDHTVVVNGKNMTTPALRFRYLDGRETVLSLYFLGLAPDNLGVRSKNNLVVPAA